MGLKILLIIFLTTACGTMTRNQVMVGEFDFFMEGDIPVAAKSIPIKRISWFRELTMQTDLVYLKGESLLNLGKSNSIVAARNKCPTFLIIGLYNELNSSPRKSDIMALFLGSSSVEKVPVDDVKKLLASHPQYIENSFHQYDFHGLCFNQLTSSFELSLPGYSSAQMQF